MKRNVVARLLGIALVAVLSASAPVAAGDEKMDRLITQGGCCYLPPPWFDCTYDYPKEATDLARDHIGRPAAKVCWGELLWFGGRHEFWGACKVETDTAYVVEVWWLPGTGGYRFGDFDGTDRGLHTVRPCPQYPDGTYSPTTR